MNSIARSAAKAAREAAKAAREAAKAAREAAKAAAAVAKAEAAVAKAAAKAEAAAAKAAAKPSVLTEDLGKIFERAICLTYDTPFVGKYSYDLPRAEALAKRISLLPTVFPACTHTACNGSPYDYTALDITDYLSAKTAKKGDGKVCPQVIGQPSRARFCQHFGLPADTTDIPAIKEYITTNLPALLTRYEAHTFDCAIIYYNAAKDTVLFIRQTTPIPWSTLTLHLSHVLQGRAWNESTTLYLDSISIGEFQIHTGRDCIKFRWCFEKLLAAFPDNFAITPL